MSINALSANTTQTKPECDAVLSACDKALNDLEAKALKLEEIKGLQGELIETQRNEIDRLRDKNDAWYHREPWMLAVLSVLVGAVAYSTLKD